MRNKKSYRYFLPEYGSTAEDAYDLETEWEDSHPQYIAEDAAEDYWDEHDGWEDIWPKLITVILSDGTQHTYSVDMEARPHFYAREPKQPLGMPPSEKTK